MFFKTRGGKSVCAKRNIIYSEASIIAKQGHACGRSFIVQHPGTVDRPDAVQGEVADLSRRRKDVKTAPTTFLMLTL